LDATVTKEGIHTGVKEIDDQLGGGIRKGSLTLIEGYPDSGKSTICQYLAHFGLDRRLSNAVYYSTQHGVREIMDNMESLSLNTVNYLLADMFRIYPLRLPATPRDALKASYLLRYHIAGLPLKFNMAVIDSITPILRQLTPVQKMDFFHECKQMCDAPRTVILVADPYIFEKETYARIKFLCDYHFELNLKAIRFQRETGDERVIRIMRIKKLRGVDVDNSPDIRFEILPGTGIQVFPFTKFST